MKLITTIGAFLFSGIVAATPLHNIVVFGDSLSDNGNLYEFMKHQLPQSPPYFEGRFSNGPVWIEHLTASYFPKDPQSHLLDYAFGGSGVSDDDGDDALFTLKREMDNYFDDYKEANADSLYVVWIGANNYLGMPSEVEQTLKQVNTGIARGLDRLVQKGAKHILLLNIPDLGRTPAAYEFGSADVFSYFSTQHNKSLNETIADLKQKYPDIEWLFFDLNRAFDDVLEHAGEYGFNNITETCVNSVVDDLTNKSVLNIVARTQPKIGSDACDGYLFFDLVHPTALAHKILSEKARVMLDEAGVEFSNE
ncbi:GDSL family lysophospholipase PlaA [Legionella fallonii]|uniref:Lysophospholipase A n=1 Tax=Legionella fallonii LLAP-10 TaxID=1212491 RepID=A0A098G995_9GAMM|nr:SGNH/GDSL hydrolase family protein [Legionella fallonii]CEG58579.1 Lysophospholipase A [Legionella fallonii LLAP-10]